MTTRKVLQKKLFYSQWYKSISALLIFSAVSYLPVESYFKWILFLIELVFLSFAEVLWYDEERGELSVGWQLFFWSKQRIIIPYSNIRNVLIEQNSERYYEIKLDLQDGSKIFLERQAVLAQAVEFQNKVKESVLGHF